MKNKVSHKELANLAFNAQKGDEASFAKLYAYIVPSIYYVVLKIVKDENNADDIVQETFIKLYANLNKLEQPQAIVDFANRIAYNTAISFLKNQKDIAIVDEEDIDFDSSNFKEGHVDFIPEEYYEQKEKRDYILKLVDELNEINRAVILMFYYQELSVKEIADILQISQDTVKARLFRARESIKRQLSNNKARKGIVAAMSVMTLSKILQLDAQALSTPGKHINNWTVIGKEIGFSDLNVVTTQKLVENSLTKATLVGNSASTVIPAATLAKVIAAITTGAVIVGSTVAIYNKTPRALSKNRLPVEVVTTGGEIIETQKIYDEKYIADINAEGASVASLDDIYNPDAIPPIAVMDKQEPCIEEEAVNSPSSMLNFQPKVSITKHLLYYPQGTKLTVGKILNDSGATSENATEILVYHLDKVDTIRPKQYGVYVQAKDDKGNLSNLEGIIIYIQ